MQLGFAGLQGNLYSVCGHDPRVSLWILDSGESQSSVVNMVKAVERQTCLPTESQHHAWVVTWQMEGPGVYIVLPGRFCIAPVYFGNGLNDEHIELDRLVWGTASCCFLHCQNSSNSKTLVWTLFLDPTFNSWLFYLRISFEKWKLVAKFGFQFGFQMMSKFRPFPICLLAHFR